MKVAAQELLKFKKLKRRLGLPQWGVIGVLESLWLFTQRNCPEGDVGRFDNEDIAAGIDWDGDPDALICDLTDTGWLDADPVHRLIVHDWQEHAPTWVSGNLRRNGREFAKPTPRTYGPAENGGSQRATTGAVAYEPETVAYEPETVTYEPAENGTSQAATNPSPPIPSPPIPNQQAKPAVFSSDGRDPPPPDGPDSELVPSDHLARLAIENEFIAEWNKLPRGKGGVVPVSSGGMPANLRGDFWELRHDPVQWQATLDAMAAIRAGKLRNGIKIALRKFLQPTTADEILGGLHDFSPNDRGQKKAAGFLEADAGGQQRKIKYDDLPDDDEPSEVLKPKTGKDVRDEAEAVF